MRPGKDGGSLTGADGTLTSGATGGQEVILDPLSRDDRERAGAAAQAEVVRLRAENERLRTFERAFAKVPQEHQARILEAVRAEAAVDGSDAGRGDWESER